MKLAKCKICKNIIGFKSKDEENLYKFSKDDPELLKGLNIRMVRKYITYCPDCFEAELKKKIASLKGKLKGNKTNREIKANCEMLISEVNSNRSHLQFIGIRKIIKETEIYFERSDKDSWHLVFVK